MKRILVIKLRAIGDVLLSTVVLDNLRRAFPAAEIHFLTEPAAAGLLPHEPSLDKILVFDRKRMTGIDLIRTVRRARYDLVLDLFGNPRTALVTWLSGAENRVGFRFRGRAYAYNHCIPPRGDRVHNTQFNLDALESIGVPIVTRVPSLAISEQERTRARELLAPMATERGPTIAINAGGGWYTKRWGVERFAELADILAAQHHAHIVVLWGPGERAQADELAQMMKSAVVIPPATSLLELAGLLEQCDLLVTNDSGPMHIAAAMGTRVLAVFGPTNPDLQGPCGDGHRIVRQEELECLGCNLTRCPIGHPCMNELSVERVYAVARSMLMEEHGSPPGN